MMVYVGNVIGISFLFWVPLCVTLRGREGERITDIKLLFHLQFYTITDYKGLEVMTTKD